MRCLNKVMLIGRLGSSNLKSKTNAAGNTTRILELSVVTSKLIRNKDTREFVEKPTWHSISVFGESAIEYALKYEKGDVIYIDGYLEKFKYVKPTGEEHETYKIVVDVSGNTRIFSKKSKDGVDAEKRDDSSSNDDDNDYPKQKRTYDRAPRNNDGTDTEDESFGF